MKKHLVNRLFTSLTAVLATTLVFAQEPNAIAISSPKPATASAIAALMDAPLPEPANTAVYVKAKVMRSFTDLFGDAADVKWSTANGQYFASFTQDGKQRKALFSNGGALINCFKYGAESDLPADVRKLVKSNYVDYTISGVTELTTRDWKAWVVNLMDKNNLVIACVYDGNLEELHQYQRQR